MIKIIGPRDKSDPNAVNTTSHSANGWSSGLSPFNLGPPLQLISEAPSVEDASFADKSLGLWPL